MFSRLTATLAFLAAAPHHANTGMEPCVGEISYVAFNYAPNGWLQCDGQILPINQYNALFSLLDTTYGGDGATNFKLPDMRGRTPLHQGRNLDGSAYSLGQMGGTENTTLTINQLPAHTHPVTAISTSTSAVAPGATALHTEGREQRCRSEDCRW